MKWEERKICYECGREVTHRKTYLIISEDTRLPIEACDICHARYVRRREAMKNGRKKKKS